MGLIQTFEKRGWIERLPHPSDGRALGLHPTEAGRALMVRAEDAAQELEIEHSSRLNPSERQRLITLLQKVYLP